MLFETERARPEDLPAARELLLRGRLPVQGLEARSAHYLVVRDAGRLVGLAGVEVHGPDGLLRSVVVDAQYRGEGVGAALVEGVLALSRRLGLGAVYLLTTTARDYFLGKGFSDCPREEAPAQIRESWEFKTGCPSSSAFMRRSPV